MSRWFGDLANVILRWDQIYLKYYQIIFPSSAHWPRSHSGWMSYGPLNGELSGCRWTESSTLMDLHFETYLYLHSNNGIYMWNQVNCTQNYYVNVETSTPYNQWSYPLVSCPHHPWWGRDSRSSVRFKITIDLVGSDTPIRLQITKTQTLQP
jgi:hypothetical protein